MTLPLKKIASAVKKQTLESLDDSKVAEEDDPPEVYALASGNLGLVSFTWWSHRMSLEEIEEAFPAVIPGLAEHEGVGFLMVRSNAKGPVVIGADRIYYLDNDRVEGQNPLSNFKPNTPDHLRRTDSFSNCPDIVINSFYDPEKAEGCAFEELIGFHGGFGGSQTQPFLLHPAELQVNGHLVDAAAAYQQCKNWLNQLQSQEINSHDQQHAQVQTPEKSS